MIYVIARIELVAGARDAFLQQFCALVPQVRREKGCIEYQPLVDVGTQIGSQPAPRDDVVVVAEKWETVEDLEDHLMAPHMVEYRRAVKSLVANTVLEVLQPAC